jgi:hypothetical protein
VLAFTPEILPRQIRGALWHEHATWAPFLFLNHAEFELEAAARNGLAHNGLPATAYFPSLRLVSDMTRFALSALTYLTVFPRHVQPHGATTWRLWIPEGLRTRGVNEEMSMTVFAVRDSASAPGSSLPTEMRSPLDHDTIRWERLASDPL